MALTKIPSSLLDTSSGFDLQGNITLGDNEQIQLGASGDLAIYHDGSHSFITDSGTGNLRLQGTNLTLQNAAGTKNYFLGSDGGAVTLYHNNDAKIATSSTGATVTGNLAVTGDLDITGNVNSYNVTDLDVTDQTITLGAGQTEANSGGSGIIIDGSSASILWNETDSVFDFNKDISLDNGLFFGSQDFYLYRSEADVATLRVGDSGSYKYFSFTDTGTVARFSSASGAVSLGSGANDHLLINSSGLVMIGTSTPSGLLNVDGNLHYGGQLRVNDPSHDGTESNPSICVGYDNDNGFFRPASNTIAMTTAGTERMRITATGNVGIGTNTPARKVQIQDTSASVYLAVTSANNNAAGIMFGDTDDETMGRVTYDNSTNGMQFWTNDGQKMFIDSSGNVGIAGTPPSDANTGYPLLSIGETTVIQGLNDSNESFFTNNAIWKSDNSWEYVKNVRAVQMAFADGTTIFRQAASGTAGNDITWSESMRIDNSGNLLVGQTIASSGTVGISLRADGRTFFCADGTYAAHFNRNTSDGAIAHFVKDDSIVGNIGVINSNNLFISGSVASHAGIQFGTNTVAPMVAGAGADDAVDLGSSTDRFQDLYLSGGAYIGGTGSANHLDAYEEGTYTPTITPATSGSVTINSYTSYAYTKVGRLVTVTGLIRSDSQSSPQGDARISLPFTVANLTSLSGRFFGTVKVTGLSWGTSGYLVAEASEGQDYFTITVCEDNGSQSTLDANLFVSGIDTIAVGFQYFTNA